MVLSWGRTGLISVMRLSSQPSLLFVHVTKDTKPLVKVDVFILNIYYNFFFVNKN